MPRLEEKDSDDESHHSNETDEAQRGGVPSTFNHVNSFVGVKFNNITNVSLIGLQDGLVEESLSG